MRIGILTYHRSINCGAVMQCYSLSKKLQQCLPQATVEVVDYHMPLVDEYYDNEMKNYFLFMFTDQLNKIFIKNEQKTEFKNLIEIEMNLITYKIVLGFLYAKNNSENILSIIANSSIKQSQNDLNSLIKYFLLTGIKNYVNKEPTKLINVYYDIINLIKRYVVLWQ